MRYDGAGSRWFRIDRYQLNRRPEPAGSGKRGVCGRTRHAATAILAGYAVAGPAAADSFSGLSTEFRNWLLLSGIAAIVAAYWIVVRRLRRRARAEVTPVVPPDQDSFSTDEMERYARHIVLREIGGAGQKRLSNARVLVIGAGGLGSSSLLYLAAAGVGTIGVIDDDTVSASNLQRQVIHAVDRLGMPKTDSARMSLERLNPHIAVNALDLRLTPESVDRLLGYDLILDGSDNFATRQLVNGFCRENGVPLIFGAIGQWEGQVTVFDGKDGPCLSCIFPKAPEPGLAPSCAEGGVLGALPGVIGSMMAAEAIKLITGAGATLASRLFIYDALWGENRTIDLQRRADCEVCGPAGSE